MNLLRNGLVTGVGMILVCAVNTPRTLAQATGSPTLKFEVASIRRHTALAPTTVNGKTMAVGTRMSFSGSRAMIENVSLSGLVVFAYDLKIDSVSGGPRWADSDRFDIAAKAEGQGNYTKDQFRQMFQTLLAERFKVKFHLDTKGARGYSLVVAKNGPKLASSPPDAESSMKLGGTNYSEMTVSKWTMKQLAFQLSVMTGRITGGSLVPASVEDRTGLTGSYDFKLKWADDDDPKSDRTLPSMFTALQEQLGLKLEPQKASVQALVIDSSERPSEN